MRARAAGSESDGPAHERLGADRHQRVLEDALAFARELGVDLGAHVIERSGHLTDRQLRLLDGRAGRHRELGGDVVAFDRREEGEWQPPAREQTERDDEDRNRGGQRRVAPVDRPLEEGAVALLDEAAESVGARLLDPVPATAARALSARGPGLRHVGGQDQLRLDQREDQAQDHDKRDAGDHLTHPARHEEQGRKRDDGREHAEDHGNGHGLRPFDRALDRIPEPLLMRVRALPDDDRIVDQDSEHQDEREERDHVDRDPEYREEPQRSRERDRHTYGDPDGQSQPHEQRQQAEHQ